MKSTKKIMQDKIKKRNANLDTNTINLIKKCIMKDYFHPSSNRRKETVKAKDISKNLWDSDLQALNKQLKMITNLRWIHLSKHLLNSWKQHQIIGKIQVLHFPTNQEYSKFIKNRLKEMTRTKEIHFIYSQIISILRILSRQSIYTYLK